MSERNLLGKLGLIVVVVGMCLWQSYPPQERLKKGIDLAGGHSLLFEIDMSGDAGNDPQLAENVMSTLKQRVDPLGQRNLVWRPVGRNRLEIQMPRPPEGRQKLQEEYDAARQAIVDTVITEAEIREVLSMTPDQRDKAIAEMSKVITARKPLLEELVAAQETYERLTATTQPAEGEAAKEIDQAIQKRIDMREKLMQTNIDVGVVVDLLELGPKNETRIEGLEKLKADDPDNALKELAPLIDTLAEKYDAWSTKKGMLDDPDDLIRLLRGAGILEFRILAQTDSSNPGQIASSNPQYNEPLQKYVDQLEKYGPRRRPGDNYRWFKIVEKKGKEWPEGLYIIREYAGARYVLSHSTPDMGLLHERPATWTLKMAYRDRDQVGRPSVGFVLDTRGGNLFGELTGANQNRPLCIFLDDEAISAASINTQIFDRGIITGTFSDDDVQYLVNTLNAGTLIASLKEVPLQEKSVGPSLGETNQRNGQNSVIFALIFTVLFMAVYYTYAGFIADLALTLNLVLTIGIMSFLQATFTLPGVAGLILMLGMAVDANVLIYERIREEMGRGVSVRMAVKLGYEKAFSAILDSNVTSIITALILYSIGSEEIKGFGLTLGLGLCTSLFTALFVTRQYFNFMVPESLDKDEVRKVGSATVVLALLGGALFGVGRMYHTAQDPSTLYGLGTFLLTMLGTALFLIVTMWLVRMIHHSGFSRAGRLPMLKLLSAPTIDWMSKYRMCWSVSAVVIVAGIVWEAGVDWRELLDIEFIGGTKVQVEFKDEFAADITDERIHDEFLTGSDPTSRKHAAGWLRWASGQLAGASVSSVGDGRYQITNVGELNGDQLEGLLTPTFEPLIDRNGLAATDGGMTVQFSSDVIDEQITSTDAVQKVLGEAAEYVKSAADRLAGARVQLVQEGDGEDTLTSYEIITTESNRGIVREALVAAMGDMLKVTRSVESTLVKDVERAPNGAFVIKQEHEVLSDVIGVESSENVADFKGGVAYVFENLSPAQSQKSLQKRIVDLRFQADFEALVPHRMKVIGLERASGNDETGNPLYSKFVYLATDTNLLYEDDPEAWQATVAEPELKLVQAALGLERSLQRVTQFAPQVAGEASQKAVIAMIISLIAIAGYLWLRFGSIEYGVAGIIALYHDVAITLSAIFLCHWIHDTAIGQLLMLEDFKIDLTLIAAFLTIIGFSINDTIVIFDRVRENRGRMARISPTLVNKSINETLSRTMITSLTFLIVVVVMYIVGGDGVHGFAFALTVGALTGVYSTIAIATPMILHRKAMSVVSVFIAAVTLAGLVMMLPESGFQKFLWAVIGLGAAFGLFKMLKSESEPLPQDATA